MRKIVRLILMWGAVLLVATGCVGCAGFRKTVESLAKDDATVTVNIGSVYGTARIVRTNPRSDQDVTIAPDGTVTIKGHSVAPVE